MTNSAAEFEMFLVDLVTEFIDRCEGEGVTSGIIQGDDLYISTGVLLNLVDGIHRTNVETLGTAESNYASAAMSASVRALAQILHNRLTPLTAEDVIGHGQ